MKTVFTFATALTLVACSTLQAPPSATASLQPTKGNQVSGRVTFTQQAQGVLVAVDVQGLTANAEHGFHIHEKGDCSSGDGMSTGGHFNPATKDHGMPNSSMSHAGDMPNIKSDANGNATYTAKLHGFAVNTGPNGIVGRSVVVHRDPDDYKSQPAGNSGPRIACGLIK